MIHSKPTPALGAKALGLYRLRATGLRVPEFVVISAETFGPVPAPPDDAALDRHRQRLETFRLSEPDRAELARVLAAWGFPAQAVVVRSSVADEDGTQDSFAGLMDSFLNLTTPESVHAAIARCAASAFSPRARAYRRQKGLTLAARPAVIVQRQVVPEASGVLFSTFPEYPQELALHAVWGFGDGLVGGELEPDEFYFAKATGTLHRQKTAFKPLQHQPRPGAPGLEPGPVPADRQSVPCLNPARLDELFRIGTLLERRFGHPQDIEFVVAENGVWIVQARPITQPIPEVVVYDNSNIQESYCGVTTPLTFSFAQRAYATVYRQTMQVLGLPAAQIAALEPVVTNLLGLVRGRIYYHLNHWYRGLQLLPAFRQNKADLERMMGVQEPVDFVTDREKSLGEKLRLLPRLLVNLARLLRAFGRLDRAVPAFQAQVAGEFRRFYEQPLDALPATELLDEKNRLDTHLLRRWTTPIVNDFYVMMTQGRVVRGLTKAGFDRPDEFLSRYLSGDQQLASTQPTHRMQALARQAATQPDLRRLIVALPPGLPERVRVLAPDFHREVGEFLDQFGDRTVGELKLETRTMRVDPLVFYKYLRNYLTTDTPPEPDAAAPARLSAEARQELDARLGTRSRWFGRRLRANLARLRQAIRYREALRLERTRLFGMYRSLYLAMGRWLVGRQRLGTERDVFYLTETELAEALRQSDATDWAERVDARRREFAGYATEDVPARVTVPAPPVGTPPVPEAEPGVLRGTGCYPGVAQGPVRVITDPADDLDVAGRIVCALRTDPGWAALFPLCRGVLIEKGSSLSHSVILLRELGIPTIINVPALTRRLATDQRVRMNGETGEIQLLPDGP